MRKWLRQRLPLLLLLSLVVPQVLMTATWLWPVRLHLPGHCLYAGDTSPEAPGPHREPVTHREPVYDPPSQGIHFEVGSCGSGLGVIAAQRFTLQWREWGYELAWH